MDLYGVAIAALPEKNRNHVITLTCTPIAVSSERPEIFQILKDLAFTKTFDTGKPQEVIDVFEQTANTIDTVVGLQHKSLHADGKEYRPVSLEVGIKYAAPINIELLFANLFGKELIDSRHQLKPEQYVNFWNKRGEQLSDEVVTQYAQSYDKPVQDALKRHRQNGPRFSNIKKDSRMRRACGKLAKCLDQCSLQFARFNISTFSEENTMPEQHDLEQRLIELKKSFDDGDESARIELIQIAKQRGIDEAIGVRENNLLSNGFGFPRPWPENADDDQELREKHPQFSFYDWHPAFRRAFFDGYNEISRQHIPYNRTLKLPLDPKSPFFTDPCAWMVRDQLEIAEGKREPHLFEDQRMADGRLWSQEISSYLAGIANQKWIWTRGIKIDKKVWSEIEAHSRDGWRQVNR